MKLPERFLQDLAFFELATQCGFDNRCELEVETPMGIADLVSDLVTWEVKRYETSDTKRYLQSYDYLQEKWPKGLVFYNPVTGRSRACDGKWQQLTAGVDWDEESVIGRGMKVKTQLLLRQHYTRTHDFHCAALGLDDSAYRWEAANNFDLDMSLQFWHEIFRENETALIEEQCSEKIDLNF